MNRAADRAMRANRLLDLDLDCVAFRSGVGLADHVVRKLTRKRPGPDHEARTLQKRPPVHRRKRGSRVAAETRTGCRDLVIGACVGALTSLGVQHDPFPPTKTA